MLDWSQASAQEAFGPGQAGPKGTNYRFLPSHQIFHLLIIFIAGIRSFRPKAVQRKAKLVLDLENRSEASHLMFKTGSGLGLQYPYRRVIFLSTLPARKNLNCDH